MNITTSITLNMQTPGYVVAYEPQGNKLSRFITATLKNGSASWSVPSGATAMIRVAKPDGTFAVYDKNEKGQNAYTISGSTVTIELVGAALAAAGDALVTVMFLDSTGSNLSPFSFRLVIMPTAVSDDDIASSDYFNVFQDTINQLQAFYGAPLTAATASAMTDTTRVYVYVGSESGYVYGHWYYYNGSTWVNGGVYNSEGINSNWLYAAYPTETISNVALANFSDGADNVPVKTLRLAINPVQSGTGDPSPENERPITGWTGAKIYAMGQNLVQDPDYADGTVAGVSYTKNFDGSYSAKGTVTGVTERFLLRWTTNKLYKPGNYELSCLGDVSNAGIRFVCAYRQNLSTNVRYREITSSGQKLTFTIEEGGYINALYFRGQTSGTPVDTTLYPMLQLAEDAEVNYTSHDGTIYNITIPTEVGTVYGGYLTDNGDGTWTLTVDRAMYTLMPSLSWSVSTGSGFIQFFATLSGMKNSLTAISNKFQPMQLSERPTKTGMVRYNDSVIRFSLTTADSSAMGISNLGEWQTWINNNNVQIVYDLATPLTYTLTAPEVTTLLGINNIWADTGDIEEIAYRADIGLYLVEALNPIKEMLANREDGMKATRAYSTGDYIVVGDTFYRAATAIANGATLTPGTNVNATTVGAQLKLLS